ncbi:MAG: hypothetical protein RLZZ546_541, partial [Bacteroidota bacterium]
KGEYEKAFSYAIEKIAGKKDKKTKYVKAIEKAYSVLNSRDLDRIAELNASNHSDKYDKLYHLYVSLENRQERVKGIIPLISEDGYVAELSIENYSILKADVVTKAKETYYSRGLELLEKGKSDKNHAKSAYYAFTKIDQYDKYYKNIIELKSEALYYGTTHIAIDIKDSDREDATYSLNRKLQFLNLDKLNSKWEKYYFIDRKKSYDKYVVIEIDDLEFGFEKEKVNNYEMTALVEEGIEYVYDTKGNVVKDSLGNKISVPKKVLKKAWVSEIFREKTSRANAKVLLYHEAKSLPAQNIPVTVYHNFADSAIRFTGDRRALSHDVCNRLDDYIQDFPTFHESIDLLGSNMLNAIESAISKLNLS